MEENFLYHKISEEEKLKIKKQALALMDKFATSIEKIKQIKQEENFQEARKETNGKEPDKNFRDITFKNAPKTKDNCIEAERGKWN